MTYPANLKHCEKCGHVRCYACGRALCTCHTREDATCDDGCRCDAKDWSLFTRGRRANSIPARQDGTTHNQPPIPL